MKKRVLLLTFMVIMLACAFVISASAAEIDYNEKATLADGAVLPIYDENNNPLIWYVSGVDENGKNTYASVPNNRNEANANNDTYVTYTIYTGWDRQLSTVNIHVYNGTSYDVITEDDVAIVVLNLRTLTDFRYIHDGLKTSDIQYVYFNEELRDCCMHFKGSTALRLVDLSVCTKMTGGFGGTRNFYQCYNLHTIRFAPEASYALTCTANNNWRFAETAIKELVIPGNITSLGVDNFKNCAQLESVYLLGNTSLGQRNFLGCTALKSVYVLDNNPTISPDDFKYNFYECVDAGKTLDFKNIGKHFFFVTEDESYLNSIKDAIGGEIIAYADYVASPASYEDGRYIISGTNICDVLYNGVHELDPENSNACAGVCLNCGEIAQSAKPEHEYNLLSITYADFTMTGTKVVECNNENCAYHEETSVEAIFGVAKFSLKDDDSAICVSYTINNEAYKAFLEANEGASLEFGIVAAASETEEIANPLNGANISHDLTNGGYCTVDLKLTGDWSTQNGVFISMALYTSYTAEDGATPSVNYVTKDGSSTACEAITYQALYDYYYPAVAE